MTEETRNKRLARLKKIVAGQDENELRTQFRAHVAEIAALESAAPAQPERKAPESPNRKKTDGHNRGK